MTTIGFIVHAPDDIVGVAIRDLSRGQRVSGAYQDGTPAPGVDVVDDIPLGHKVALAEVASGERVIKYGASIGLATRDIRAGAHVHTHNLKGERWSQ